MPSRCLRFHLFVFTFAARHFLQAPESYLSFSACRYCRLKNIKRITGWKTFLYRNTEQTDLNAFSGKITIQQAILTGRYPIVS